MSARLAALSRVTTSFSAALRARVFCAASLQVSKGDSVHVIERNEVDERFLNCRRAGMRLLPPPPCIRLKAEFT